MKHHRAFTDLMSAFEQFENRTALIDKDGRSYTYAEFRNHISGAYKVLQQKGIKKGSKVLVAVPMSLQLYAVLEALFALGATAVFLDPWMKGKKMSSVIRQVEPDLFVVTKKLSRITWLLSATWKLKKWKINEIIPSREPYEIAQVEDEDNALITFTSGTSGKPKGANRTFAFLHAQAEVLKKHLGENTEPSIDYTNFPIVGLANFALGNTVVVPQINLMKIHKADAQHVADELRKQKVTRLVVSPSLLKKILSALPKENTIQTVMTGGAPISIGLVKKGVNHFPNIKFEAIYGSTEAEPICITYFQTILKELSTPLKGIYTGSPVAETTLKIVKAVDHPVSTKQFNQLELPDTRIGEIVVTGEHVNKNYYQNEDAFLQNKIVDQDGTIWHRTGDIGYQENRSLYLVGRDHRIMKKDDQLYYPYPLEQFIEMEFGLSDIGYVQKLNGEFCLYFYSEKAIDQDEIKNAIMASGYPLDAIIKTNRPLPRDARHKSKLQIDALIEESSWNATFIYTTN